MAKTGTARLLTINARFTQVASGSNAVMAWEVFKGRVLAAKHTITLTGTKLHRGLISKRSGSKPRARHTTASEASVEVLSPGPNGSLRQPAGDARPTVRRLKARGAHCRVAGGHFSPRLRIP